MNENDVHSLGRAMGIRVLDEDAAPLGESLSRLKESMSAVRRWLESPNEQLEAPNEQAGSNGTVLPTKEATPPTANASETSHPTRPDPPFTLSQLSNAFADHRLSPVEVTRLYIDRVERYNPQLHAYITVTADVALREAKRAESEIMAGRRRGPLHGIPIAHKDLIPTAGIRTTGHCKALVDAVPRADVPLVTRMHQAGTVLLGKANTYELGCGDGDLFGWARNPYDPERQTGGSSSGSAVAVAAGMAAGATGTDAGGSIRIPSAFCGLVGLKPTHGSIYRHTEHPSSVGVAGPMALNARDAALLLSGMTRTSWNANVADLDGDIDGVIIGVPDIEPNRVDEQVYASFLSALRTFEKLGAVLKRVPLPFAAYAETVGTLLAQVECYGHYGDVLRDRAEDVGVFARRVLTLGQLHSAWDYLSAKQAAERLKCNFADIHRDVDVIASPTSRFTAFPFEQTRLHVGGEIVDPRTSMGYLSRISNVTGYPAVSLPSGFTREGLPIGLHFMGRPHDDLELLRLAHVYERAVGTA